MSKRYPPEVREKALRLALDHLDEYGSGHAAAHAIGPMVDVHPEALRVWIVKAIKQHPAPGAASAPAAGELHPRTETSPTRIWRTRCGTCGAMHQLGHHGVTRGRTHRTTIRAKDGVRTGDQLTWNARLHARLDYLTPAEYENAYCAQHQPRRPALV